MILEEVISKLQELEKQGYGKLIVAVSVETGDVEVKSLDVQLSCDGVGKFVRIE